MLPFPWEMRWLLWDRMPPAGPLKLKRSRFLRSGSMKALRRPDGLANEPNLTRRTRPRLESWRRARAGKPARIGDAIVIN